MRRCRREWTTDSCLSIGSGRVVPAQQLSLIAAPADRRQGTGRSAAPPIAKGDAASLGAVQQNEVVVFAAALVGTAISVAMLVLAAAVGIIAAAGAFAVLAGLGIAQPDICHAVFRHADILIGVGDLVINRVLTFLRVIGRGGHGAAFGSVAVADGSADCHGFGEVADR